MIKKSIIDKNGQELEAYASIDNLLLVTITFRDGVNKICFAMDYDDAVVFKNIINSSVKIIKNDL